MSSADDAPRTWADVAREHPQGFRELVEIAEEQGLDVLVEPMQRAIELAEDDEAGR